MPNHVDQVLEQRRHRVGRGERRRTVAASVVGHLLLTVVFLGLPALLAEPPEPIDSIAVTVISPKALGEPDPVPPTRPEPEETPPEETPPPPPPEPEDDRPVLPDPEPEPKPRDTPPPPPPSPPPPRPSATEAPSPLSQPPTRTQRRGSIFGDPLGSSTNTTTVGVEDPNFTYGYYVDLVANAISEQWDRPRVGADVGDAEIYFRILSTGDVTDLEIRKSSGSQIFDESALRAVRQATIPPLPKGYDKSYLGIQLVAKRR